jgi:hypothetical protein
MDARPGVEVRREVPGDAPPAPPPPAVMPPADKLPEVMPRVAPRVDPKVEPVVPQGPEPPVVERVPSKAPAVPQGTPFLTRQPSPSPSSPSSTVVKQRQPTRPVDLGTSIPLVLPAPQVPPQNVPTPGYCDDPRFANTELCYKGGVPASQGRGPMAVIEKGNPEIKGASVVERVPGVLNVPNLNFKGAAGPSKMGFLAGQYAPSYSAPARLHDSGVDEGTGPNWKFGSGADVRPTSSEIPGGFTGASPVQQGVWRGQNAPAPFAPEHGYDYRYASQPGQPLGSNDRFPPGSPSPVVRVADIVPSLKGAAGPSHAIVGPMVGQYRPARGPSLSIERSSIPASQYMPGQGLLPVSNYMPPSPIKGVSGLAGAGAGVPRSRREHNPSQGPSIEMVGVPVAQYRPAGLGLTYEQAITAEQCAGISGTWDAANRRCTPSEASDPSKPGGPDHTDAILGAVSTGLGALGQTITRILELENQRIQGRLTAEGNQAIELERIRAQRDLANAQSALNDARSQGANDSALQALSAQLAALQAQAQNAGVQVGMSTPAKIGLAVGGVAIVGGFAYLLARNAGGARSNPSHSSRSTRASRASRRNGRAGRVGSQRGRR